MDTPGWTPLFTLMVHSGSLVVVPVLFGQRLVPRICHSGYQIGVLLQIKMNVMVHL
jgi:hypothetical protein